MAPSDQDPESERRKDAAFERILAEALSSGARKEDCPDAETLAAFYEHALGPAEAAPLRAHFAFCSRCQQVLAAMAASDPNPLAQEEIAHLGELVAAASAPRKVLPHAAVLKPRALNWPRYLDPRTLAPLAAAAILVVALWGTLHSPNQAPGQLAFEFPPAPPFSAPVVAGNKTASPPNAQSTSLPASGARQALSSPPPGAAVPRRAPTPAAAPSPSPAAPGESASHEQSQSASAGYAQEAAPPPPPPPVVSRAENVVPGDAAGAAQSSSGSGAGVGGAVAGGAPAANAPSERITSRTESVTVGSAEEDVVVAAPSAKADRARAGFSGIVASPRSNSLVAWRFGRRGSIERSTDGGATWTSQSSPVQTDLLAGSAPSETICWVVGRSGTILRTTDGDHWEIVPSPPQAVQQNGGAPDWTSVEARDALSATVSTKDGRRYSTADAGKTWQPQ